MVHKKDMRIKLQIKGKENLETVLEPTNSLKNKMGRGENEKTKKKTRKKRRNSKRTKIRPQSQDATKEILFKHLPRDLRCKGIGSRNRERKFRLKFRDPDRSPKKFNRVPGGLTEHLVDSMLRLTV